jgi:hypothetical protein
VLIAVLALPAAWRGGTPGRLVALRFGLACLGAAVAIAPWAARNWARFDQPVIGSNNSGSVIAGANCDQTYSGREIGRWEFDCVGLPKSPNEAEAASRQRAKGIEYARDHADRVPLVMAVRVLRSWDLYQPWRTAGDNEGRNPTMARIGIVVYWLLLPLAIYGAVILRRRHEPLRLLLAPVLLVTIVSALGWGLTRFRHPAEITIVVLAAVGGTYLLKRDHRRAAPTG